LKQEWNGMEVVREDKEQRKEESLLMGKCGRE